MMALMIPTCFGGQLSICNHVGAPLLLRSWSGSHKTSAFHASSRTSKVVYLNYGGFPNLFLEWVQRLPTQGEGVVKYPINEDMTSVDWFSYDRFGWTRVWCAKYDHYQRFNDRFAYGFSLLSSLCVRLVDRPCVGGAYPLSLGFAYVSSLSSNNETA
ncbi:hypothetical protein VNO78_22956 [Psophocarpus tetragonolobus]|uniref:Uncharacterized protein n=1 Tax=Psophocarpus tetragonolobus TaxID=3891 RepID=A0AAN9S5N9_PSOTE